MPDDKKISQLISKSLRHELNTEESAQVDAHLNANEETRQFARISRLIQDSVTNTRVTSNDETRGLSDEARQRIKDSVSEEIKLKLSLSQAGATSVGQTLTMGSASIRSATHETERRQLISKYKLMRRLGQGGLGNVWLARDEILNRNVAIKELKISALDSEKAWQRFHREAEITGHLEHPNVVPLYQYGVDQKSGEPFYAMRFIGKRTLADAIVEHYDRVEAGEAGALGLHRLLTVFLDVCQAIAYAHSRGVIHRDLKPENVGLDNFGQVIVLDWGLAKVLEDSELASKMTCESNPADCSFLSQTQDGDVVGTPLYMAPEQASGQLDLVDDKTDVYGLGAILFAILTGFAPHEKSASDENADILEILKRIASSDTPRAADYGKCVPADLETICSKAMAPKRHLRFESVQDLADAVERWIAGQSEKQAGYDSLRMEGRELRADLHSSVRDLERNVRFAAGLPPIEQLIIADSDEDVSIWRERLATIFQGLLRANPDYSTIVYNRVDGDRFSELVRVERHSSESANLRVVPKSRLRSDATSEYIKALTEMKPEEVLTSLVCDPTCERNPTCSEKVGLLVGVPVYNAQTEDVFGVVMIHCDIDKILRRQMSRRMEASEIVVACDVFNIMMHSKNGLISEETLTKTVTTETPHFSAAVDELQSSLEYIDSTNSDVYGARLWFTPNKHGIMYLLKRKQLTQ